MTENNKTSSGSNGDSNGSDGSKKPGINRFAILAGVVILFIIGSYLLKDGPLQPGDEAPLWNLAQANGAEGMLSLESHRGRVVLLDFWSTSCPPCLMQIPVLKQIRADFPDVEVIGVAVGGEPLAVLKQFAAQRNVQYPIVGDLKGIAATTYNVHSLPTMFIVDEKGVIVATHQGFWPHDALKAEVRKVLVD